MNDETEYQKVTPGSIVPDLDPERDYKCAECSTLLKVHDVLPHFVHIHKWSLAMLSQDYNRK